MICFQDVLYMWNCAYVKPSKHLWSLPLDQPQRTNISDADIRARHFRAVAAKYICSKICRHWSSWKRIAAAALKKQNKASSSSATLWRPLPLHDVGLFASVKLENIFSFLVVIFKWHQSVHNFLDCWYIPVQNGSNPRLPSPSSPPWCWHPPLNLGFLIWRKERFFYTIEILIFVCVRCNKESGKLSDILGCVCFNEVTFVKLRLSWRRCSLCGWILQEDERPLSLS